MVYEAVIHNTLSSSCRLREAPLSNCWGLCCPILRTFPICWSLHYNGDSALTNDFSYALIRDPDLLHLARSQLVSMTPSFLPGASTATETTLSPKAASNLSPCQVLVDPWSLHVFINRNAWETFTHLPNMTTNMTLVRPWTPLHRSFSVHALRKHHHSDGIFEIIADYSGPADQNDGLLTQNIT